MSGGLSTLMHSHLSGVVVNEIGIGSLLATEFVAGSRSHDHEKGSGSGSFVFSCVISLFLFLFSLLLLFVFAFFRGIVVFRMLKGEKRKEKKKRRKMNIINLMLKISSIISGLFIFFSGVVWLMCETSALSVIFSVYYL